MIRVASIYVQNRESYIQRDIAFVGFLNEAHTSHSRIFIVPTSTKIKIFENEGGRRRDSTLGGRKIVGVSSFVRDAPTFQLLWALRESAVHLRMVTHSNTMH